MTPANNPPTTSSNPWNITSTLNPTSTSPSYANMSMNNQASNLLYPTVPSANNANPTSTSPLPSSLSSSRKTPESFLGDKFSTLVNLDQLVTDQKSMINIKYSFIFFSIFHLS